jgi:hypothetical protein
MRILFSLSHAGQSRNVEPVLRLLGARGHAVTVVLHREERGSAGGALLERLTREVPELRVERAPQRRQRSRVGVAFRLALDYDRYLEPAYADADALRARARGAVPPPLRLAVDGAARSGLRAPLRAAFRAAERRASDPSRLADLLDRLGADLAVVSPLVDLGAPQVEVLRAARSRGIPSALLVASWDNLTTKGTLHELPDRVLVWNDAQRDEAVRLHGVPPERVAVVGAAAWDHWLDGGPTADRASFCTALGLDASRQYVLYVGSSPSLAPDEGSFVTDWLESIRERGTATPQVLVRPHPLNELTASERTALDRREAVAVDLATAGDERSRIAYADAVHHAAAVVGLNTSGLLEATLAGRPALVPTSERYRATQWGTLHFRDILAAPGSPLQIAPLGPAHRAQLEDALAAPEAGAEEREAFVAAFVRPAGPGPAALRVVETLEALA